MITLLAPAKLTWYLEVTGVRPNGYHELRSEMVTVSLADRLTLEESADYLRLANRATLSLGEDNLICRALAVAGRRVGVTLEKNIPLGGGLGGGSADAAAILRWAGGVAPEIALGLGGDVPFCQVGGRALVEGVGERVRPLPFESRALTLFLADYAVATPAVYAAYDELVQRGERPAGRNHLERPAVMVEPRVGVNLAYLRGLYGDVHLAGSGATMFVEGHVGNPRLDVQGPAGLIQIHHVTTTPAERAN